MLCREKAAALREFMALKNEYEEIQSDIRKFDLRNSITPAIQNQVMMTMKVPYQYRDVLYAKELHPRNVQHVFQESCNHVPDWTQAIDYGPFE